MFMKKLETFKQKEKLEILESDDLDEIKGGDWWDWYIELLFGGCPPPWEED